MGAKEQNETWHWFFYPSSFLNCSPSWWESCKLQGTESSTIQGTCRSLLTWLLWYSSCVAFPPSCISRGLSPFLWQKRHGFFCLKLLWCSPLLNMQNSHMLFPQQYCVEVPWRCGSWELTVTGTCESRPLWSPQMLTPVHTAVYHSSWQLTTVSCWWLAKFREMFLLCHVSGILMVEDNYTCL